MNNFSFGFSIACIDRKCLRVSQQNKEKRILERRYIILRIEKLHFVTEKIAIEFTNIAL
jgi:hypothetical protein